MAGAAGAAAGVMLVLLVITVVVVLAIRRRNQRNAVASISGWGEDLPGMTHNPVFRAPVSNGMYRDTAPGEASAYDEFAPVEQPHYDALADRPAVYNHVPAYGSAAGRREGSVYSALARAGAPAYENESQAPGTHYHVLNRDGSVYSSLDVDSEPTSQFYHRLDRGDTVYAVPVVTDHH